MSKDLRFVKVYKWERVAGTGRYERVFDRNAEFHQFGVGYEEFEAGPGNFSTGIVEFSDGSIGNIPVELLEFVKD